MLVLVLSNARFVKREEGRAVTSVGLFWFFFRERERNAFLFRLRLDFSAIGFSTPFSSEGNELEGVGTSEHLYPRARGRARPRPGCSRAARARWRRTPPRTRANDPGRSARATARLPAACNLPLRSERCRFHASGRGAPRETHGRARSAMDQTSRLDDGSASGASAKGALAAAAARALDADAADAASSSDDDDDDAEAAARETRLVRTRRRTCTSRRRRRRSPGTRSGTRTARSVRRPRVLRGRAGGTKARLDGAAAAARRGRRRRVSKKSSVRRRRDVASGESLVPSVAGVVDAVSVQSAVDALVATARRLRADADAAASREADARAELAEARSAKAKRSPRRASNASSAKPRLRRLWSRACLPCLRGSRKPRTREREETQKRLCPEARREAEIAEKTEKNEKRPRFATGRARTPRNDRASLRTEPKPTTTALTETADDENAKKTTTRRDDMFTKRIPTQRSWMRCDWRR